MDADQVMREQLLSLLRGGNAHLTFDQAIADFPMAAINNRPPHLQYTPWHILEHIRIAQWDILEFVRNSRHISPKWPEGYWPATTADATPADWERTIEHFHVDLQALEAIISDPESDLLAALPHAPGYTIFREIVLVADHNAYHIGEFAILRQVMGTWPAAP